MWNMWSSQLFKKICNMYNMYNITSVAPHGAYLIWFSFSVTNAFLSSAGAVDRCDLVPSSVLLSVLVLFHGMLQKRWPTPKCIASSSESGNFWFNVSAEKSAHSAPMMNRTNNIQYGYVASTCFPCMTVCKSCVKQELCIFISSTVLTYQINNVWSNHTESVWCYDAQRSTRLTQTCRIRFHGLQINDKERRTDEELHYERNGHHVIVGIWSICGFLVDWMTIVKLFVHDMFHWFNFQMPTVYNQHHCQTEHATINVHHCVRQTSPNSVACNCE